MIQDRLTAKFKTAKPAKQPVVAPKPVTKSKTVQDPIDAAYERGRNAAGSLFWL